MINLMNKIPLKLRLFFVLFGAGTLANSCAEMLEEIGLSQSEANILLGKAMLLDDDPNNDELARLMIHGYTLAQAKEVAAAGRSNVTTNIYTNEPTKNYKEDNNSSRDNSSLPTGFFTFKSYTDWNRNGLTERNELQGYGEYSASINYDDLLVGFIAPDSPSNNFVTFEVYKENGKYIGRERILLSPEGIKYYTIGPTDFLRTDPQGGRNDLFDKIELEGPGWYQISARTEDGKKYTTEINVRK